MKISAYNFNPQPINGITIHSCGYNIISNTDGTYRSEGRNDYLLLFISESYEVFEFENTRQIAHAPAIVLFRPHEPQIHYYDGDSTAKNHYIHFSVSSGSIMNKMKINSSCIYQLDAADDLDELFEKIRLETESKSDMYMNVAEAYFEILLAYISRKTDEINPEKTYAESIKPAIKEMYHHYSENKTLSDYAGMCHISKYHFIRIFKKSTGMSPIEYRNHIRINVAKDLLTDTEMSINKISEYCGFSNANYFCDVFRKSEGLSPSAYRQAIL